MRRLASVLFLALFVILSPFFSSAQSYEKKWAIGTGVDLIDYQAPLDGNFFTPDNFDLGLNLSVGRYLSGAFAVSTNFTVAQGVRFPGYDWNQQRPRLLDMNYLLHFKFNNGALLKESAFFAPYFLLGFGGSHVKGHPDLYVPLGGGVQFKLSPKINLRTQVVIKRSINKDYQNLSHVIAFVYNLGSENPNGAPMPKQDTLGEEVFAAVPPTDTDEDGIIDLHDECPTQAGTSAHEGCPDASALALALIEEMPQTEKIAGAGPSQPKEIKLLPENNSQPKLTYIQKNHQPKPSPSVKRPSIARKPTPKANGQASFLDPIQHQHGPTAAADPSPIAFEQQNIAATKTNNLNKTPNFHKSLKSNNLSSSSILFNVGSDELNVETKEVLDEMAHMLHKDSNAQLLVRGHADAVGTDRNNLVLSIMRAYNVKYYLVYEHGISQDRIRSTGFGESNPIASNYTNDGRQQNRRVDFELVH